MNIVVTGGNGFVGRRLVDDLVKAEHEVIVLDRSVLASHTPSVRSVRCDLMKDELPLGILRGVGAVIHLAGAPVQGLWTRQHKRQVYDSRIIGAKKIIAAISSLPEKGPLPLVVSASGIGYYGDGGDKWLNEQDDPGDDFLARTCVDWENVWDALPAGARRVSLRTGIVLGYQGGLLQPLMKPIRFGWAPIPGAGTQWVSWISHRDIVRAYLHALNEPTLFGIYNVVSPNPVTFEQLVRTLQIKSNPALTVKVPRFLLRLSMGEAANLLLFSQRVSASKLQDTGFTFADPTLEAALKGKNAD